MSTLYAKGRGQGAMGEMTRLEERQRGKEKNVGSRKRRGRRLGEFNGIKTMDEYINLTVDFEMKQ